MDKEYYDSPAKVRMSRAKELLEEAVELLEKGSYKSANNRAFYAMEKALRLFWLWHKLKLRHITEG